MLEPDSPKDLLISEAQLEAYQNTLQRLNLSRVSEDSRNPEVVYFNVRGNGFNTEKDYYV